LHPERLWPVLVLSVALFVRLWGIDWQLPAALYFDEMKYVAWAGGAKDEIGASPADLRNPTLFHHLLQVEFAVSAMIRRDLNEQQTAIFELWLARVTSAILGALACALTALAASTLVRAMGGVGWGRASPPLPPDRRWWLGDEVAWAGLATGVILALAPLHVHLSHYAVNDTTASFFLAATLLFGSRALVGRRRLDLLLAGAAAGLAFSTKYSFAVGLVLPLLAAALPSRALARRCDDADGRGSRTDDLVRRASLGALTVMGFVLGAVLGAPEIVTSPLAIVAGVAEQARIGASRWNGQSEAPVWRLYAETVWYGLGWPVLALAGVGAVVLAQRSPWMLLAQLAVPLVCLAVMLRQELFFGRFALPLLPSLALLGGVGVVALARIGAHGSRSPVVAAAALSLVVLLSALVPAIMTTARHNQLATTPDTRLLALQWLRERPDSPRVATETYGQPIVWEGSQAPRGYRLQRIGSFVDPATVSRLACDDTRYFLVANLTAERELARRTRPGPTGYDILARDGRIVETFDPFWPGMAAPAHTDNTGIPFWYLDAYARPGPKIVVYELKDEAAVCAQGRGR